MNYNISRYYKKFCSNVFENGFENLNQNSFLKNIDNNCWKLSNNISSLNENSHLNVKRSFYSKIVYSYLLTYEDFINCTSDECIFKTVNKFIMLLKLSQYLKF